MRECSIRGILLKWNPNYSKRKSVNMSWCSWIRASQYNSYRNSKQDATGHQNLLFHVYMNLNMFRATHRPLSGAQNCTSSLWFCIRERLWTLRLLDATGYQNLLFHVYMKLNMFRATHRPSSGAQNCTSSLWFCISERLWTLRLLDAVSVQQPQRQQPFTYAKPEAASAVLSSWWWAVCRPKHVEFHINME